MPPKKPKPLRSKDTPFFQPFTVGFTVEQKGVINEAPRRFHAGKTEIVTWIVGNASEEMITVTLLMFLRRKKPSDETGDPNDKVDPFTWIGANAVTLDVGQTGIIAGMVDPKYTNKQVGIEIDLSYTIRVEGKSFTEEYDPDGDIKP